MRLLVVHRKSKAIICQTCW